MSEQKHTPEPWYAHSVIPKGLHAGYVHAITNSKPGGIIEDADGVWVVDFPDWDHHKSRFILRTTDSDNSKANAARIVQCVNALAGVADPAAELARLRAADRAFSEAQADANFQRQRYNAQEALWLETRDANQRISAELTKLRTLYAAAVQECRMARAALGHHTALSLRHDTARAEAGMEAL